MPDFPEEQDKMVLGPVVVVVAPVVLEHQALEVLPALEETEFLFL
jgi:hypothetical protein